MNAEILLSLGAGSFVGFLASIMVKEFLKDLKEQREYEKNRDALRAKMQRCIMKIRLINEGRSAEIGED